MSKLVQAQIEVKGIRPLLWHAFGREAIPLKKGERTGVAGNDPEEWKRTVLTTKSGELFVRDTYFFACFRNGGKNTKKGRGSMMRDVGSTLQIVEMRVPILGEDGVVLTIPNWNGGPPETLSEDFENPIYLHVDGVTNPGSRAKNVRYRVAAKEGWRAKLTARWDATIVNRNIMETIAIDGGRLHGVGDGRAIGFGRFEIEAFVVKEL